MLDCVISFVIKQQEQGWNVGEGTLVDGMRLGKI
jgi:hypothetical protein